MKWKRESGKSRCITRIKDDEEGKGVGREIGEI